MPESGPSFDATTAEEHLEDARRFEMWAERLADNKRLSQDFRELATRSRAAARVAQKRGHPDT